MNDLTDFENKIFAFEYKEKELFFKNDRKIIQSSSMFPNTQIMFDWEIKEDQYHIQVIYPLAANYRYNTYLIFIYNWQDNEVYINGYRSHTEYPPVWNREFNFGPDYIDYIKIQNHLNKILSTKNLPNFQIDDNIENKSWFGVTESPQEIEKLIKENKFYNILTLKAEAAIKQGLIKI